LEDYWNCQMPADVRLSVNPFVTKRYLHTIQG